MISTFVTSMNSHVQVPGVAATSYPVTISKGASASTIVARQVDALQGTKVRHSHLFMTDTVHLWPNISINITYEVTRQYNRHHISTMLTLILVQLRLLALQGRAQSLFGIIVQNQQVSLLHNCGGKRPQIHLQWVIAQVHAEILCMGSLGWCFKNFPPRS